MIGLVLMLVILGVCLYLIESFIPMDPTIKTVIRIIVVICMILYLLRVFGIADIPVPRVGLMTSFPSNWNLATNPPMDVRLPVGSHFFTASALDAALRKAIPDAQLEPGQHGAAIATLDADGLQVAVVFTSKDEHWRVRAAYERDWTSEQKVAGDILYRF